MHFLSRIAVVAICAVVLSTPSHAQKVVRFLSPTTDTIWLKGNATGLTWEAGTTKIVVPGADGWYGYTFPAGADVPSSNYGFMTRDYSVQCQVAIDFTKGDTAWVFPDPFPGGAGRVTYSRPRTKIVMFWNPWEYDAAGKPPRLQLEGGPWNSMATVSTLPGWYSYMVRGYSTMDLAFSDSANKKFVGASWGAAAPGRVPASIVETSDTIWVRPTPELSGGIVPSAKRPLPKVVMIFNPWDGRLPVNRPRISFSGGTTLPMVPSGMCGWYAFEFFDRSTTVSFSNDHGGQGFGSTGLGSTTGINLATVLATNDTAWISRVPATGLPKIAPNFTGEKGHCERVLLAATIRDFPTGTPGNIEFGHGKGCGRGGWSVVTGMVEPYLGADRKPIRSAYDTGRNYPNDWSFAFRCVYDTIRPQSLSEIGDSGIATNWFKTVPGKNAETCRDIPLTTDSITGDYVYDNPQYFPIDDFLTLPDGSRNPYHALMNGEDAKPHNYGFCLESHGEFEYTKGQVFDFRGDDDVWFFINGRIAVDLGGSHGAARDSIFLDSINATKTGVRDANGQIIYTKTGKDSVIYTPTDSSLVPGRTYNFDFFFCERNPLGSSMRIRTDMNLRTLSGFQMIDSTRANGSRNYALWMSTTTGQGCAARGEVRKTSSDKIRLSGPSATPAVDLGAGVSYGGITVATDFGSFLVDTAKIVGLSPGRYVISVHSPIDSTDIRRAVFIVPWTPEPRFVAKPPYTGNVGTAFPVSVASFNASGADSSAVSFQLRPIPGLRWFFDSQMTRPIPTDSVLRTPINHAPFRLWVRGDSAGTYRLVLGRSSIDSTDSWTNIEFLDKGIHFVDASGALLAPNTPIVRNIGDTVRVRVRSYNGAAVCATCVDSLVLTPSSTTLTILDASGKPATGIRLVAGNGEFLVVGKAAIESASVAVASIESGKRIVRTPISFRRPVLRWIDATGRNLTSVSVDTSVFALVGPLRLEVLGVDGPCATCLGSVSLTATAPGIVFYDSIGTKRIDSATMVGGRASLRVTGTRTVAGASLIAYAPGLDTAFLPSFTFRANAPDSGAWFDDNGDGAADRAVVYLRDKWTPTTSLKLAWPDTTALMVAAPPSLALSPDSLVGTYRPATPLAGTYTSMANSLGRWSRDGGEWIPFAMSDRIAPVAMSAQLRWGTTVDTLRIAPSEPMQLSPTTSARADITTLRGVVIGAPQSVSVDAVSGELVLLYTSGTSPQPGDSARFAAGGITDASGNLPGINSRKVAITASARPPREAAIFDMDGDGRADRVTLRFASAPRNVAGYRFRWGTSATDLEERLAGATPTSSDSGGLILVYDLAPYKLGVTSCPAGVCTGLGTMVVVDGTDTSSVLFPILDRIPPVAMGAKVAWGDVTDTLRIAPSEAVSAHAAASAIAIITATRGAALGTPTSASVDATTSEIILVYPAGTAPLPGDSAAFAIGGISDVPGNRPTTRGRNVAITGLEPPPRDAVLLDANGDGKPDRVVLRFRAAPLPVAGYAFRWGSSATALETRTAGATATESDSSGRILSFSLAPFTQVATSCPGGSCQGLGTMRRIVGTDTIPALFPLRDGVAPVAVRARLRWGAGYDTLRISASELLAAPSSSVGLAAFDALSGGTIGAATSATLDPSTGDLVLVYLSGTSPLPGDSARLSTTAADLLGNRPGVTSRKVVVQGTDRPPQDAVMLDLDGDGAADRVVLRFGSTPKGNSLFRFRWGTSVATAQDRFVGPTPTSTDSAGRIVSFDLAPYPVGATSCPTPGCLDLGSMFLLDGTDTVSTSFAVRDGVAPVLTRASLRYSAADGVPDTLRVVFSEPVVAPLPSDWISWNTPAGAPAELLVASDLSTLSPDGKSAILLVHVDSSFAPRPGDIARLGSNGGISDGANNPVGAISPWVPIELGPRPSRFDAVAYPAMRLTGPDGDPRPGEAQLRILVSHRTNGEWVTLDGSPAGDTSRFSGILLTLNAPIAGDLFIYDNLGVHVGTISLAALSEFVKSPASAALQDEKGRIRAWIAWNGAGPTGKRVADGVYTMRLVAFVQDGSGGLINKLYRLGRKQEP